LGSDVTGSPSIRTAPPSGVSAAHSILEIGAGTGYNACLLAQLTGRADLVTTIDIDPDVTAKASQALTATGYGDVHVVPGDGGLGYADHAPYDRMIATVSPWDIPVAWWKQLAPGGRLVAPLRFPVKSTWCAMRRCDSSGGGRPSSEACRSRSL
jgi:protein-L-isoaspartate(D-aspartate) O-methyltransferase